MLGPKVRYLGWVRIEAFVNRWQAEASVGVSVSQGGKGRFEVPILRNHCVTSHNSGNVPSWQRNQAPVLPPCLRQETRNYSSPRTTVKLLKGDRLALFRRFYALDPCLRENRHVLVPTTFGTPSQAARVPLDHIEDR